MTRRAFTLTEMLVVLGILLLLMGLLIPSLISAQRAAKRTQCMARVNELSRALQSYLSDYDNYLPPAGSSNGGSPGSPKSLKFFVMPVDVSKGAGRGVVGDEKKWPEELQQPEQWVGPPGFPYSVPPLAYFVTKYLKAERRIWECPAAPRNDFQMSALAEPGKDDALEGALAGIRPQDGFSPAYRYMGTADLWFGVHAYLPVLQSYNFRVPVGPVKSNPAQNGRYHAFLARNIGGLRTNNLITVRKQPFSEIVTLLEKDATYHNRSEGNFYGGNGDLLVFDGKRAPILDLIRGKWGMHVAYLDGHVDYRTFESEPEFFNSVLHDEIPQRWGYVQLLDRAHMKYPWERIGRDKMR